jgi:hypothetical protein
MSAPAYGVAQSNQALLCDIERSSKREFPFWKLVVGYAWNDLIFASWTYGEGFARLEGRNFASQEAAQQYLEDSSEVLDLIMNESQLKPWTARLPELGDDNKIWSLYYHENTVIVVREKELFFKVEASSITAAMEFSRMVISESRNPTSACIGLAGE